ncbi:MAG TPA: RsmB/NOP family class I SAM-dependent RNA methyltransferase [Parvularculaceae bacterium]|nr:RsmB/NOP family class I SAM-dependent RNA methyltransferase [Parvularculaceae bacterium]
MRDSGRVSAAIAILEDFDKRRVPLKTAIADWARNARYAGAKDRAWISGLCLDVLRRRSSLGAMMGDQTPRAATLAALRFQWGKSLDEIADLAGEEPHGPGALREKERDVLNAVAPPFTGELSAKRTEGGDVAFAPPPSAAPTPPPQAGEEKHQRLSILADFPDWLEPSVTRAFGETALQEMRAFAARADVDLRINTLQTTIEKALGAVSTVGAVAHPFLTTALRIAAPDATDRTPAVTVIPAFNKGWVEVQDLGSQIAALAAGDVKGAQVLDLCAGGGGKTLALAAMMENKGQLYAYDNDARRLKPLYDRARRAGIRNLQIVNPITDKEALEALVDKFDVVFVDAPCTGSGTWRRHPDTKWRLTEEQLARRMEEQDAVLKSAARFVKPGGRLVYVTCSFLMEENEDRLAAFCAAHDGFEPTRTLDEMMKPGLLTQEGRGALSPCETPDCAVRMTPARIGADGFFVAALNRKR